MDEAVHHDDESFEMLQPESSTVTNNPVLSQSEVIAIREDLSQIKLRKITTLGLPTMRNFLTSWIHPL